MATVYSPKDVKIAFAGIQNISGWVSLTVDRTSDNSTVTTGADGVPAYTALADKTGTLEIEVQQTNNEVNLALAAMDEAIKSGNNLLFFDVTIMDRSGGVLIGSLKDCHLQKMAPQGLGAEAGTRTHMIHVGEVEYVSRPEGFSQAPSTASTTTNADGEEETALETAERYIDYAEQAVGFIGLVKDTAKNFGLF